MSTPSYSNNEDRDRDEEGEEDTSNHNIFTFFQNSLKSLSSQQKQQIKWILCFSLFVLSITFYTYCHTLIDIAHMNDRHVYNGLGEKAGERGGGGGGVGGGETPVLDDTDDHKRSHSLDLFSWRLTCDLFALFCVLTGVIGLATRALEEGWGIFGLCGFFLSILILVPESLQEKAMEELRTFAFEDDVLSNSSTGVESVGAIGGSGGNTVLVPMCVCLCHGIRELPCFTVKGNCQDYLNSVSEAIANMNRVEGIASCLLGVIVIVSFFLTLVTTESSSAADCLHPLFASHRPYPRRRGDGPCRSQYQQQEHATAVLLTEVRFADVNPSLVERQTQAQRVLQATVIESGTD